MGNSLMPGDNDGEAPMWRPMEEADLDDVAAIAVIGFPDHFEGRACFANRFDIFPRGCFVLSAPSEAPLGYLIAYPWQSEAAPALNTLINAIPAKAEVMYLHDLALLPDARGKGHARAIVEQLAKDARADGWPAIALVAVNNSAPFWERHGFQTVDRPEMGQKLASYGPHARYMVRSLK